MNSMESSIFLKYLTVNENMDITKYKLKDKKSYGIDKISSDTIKKYSHCIIEPLIHIINYSFQEGYFPSKLKTSIITAIFIRGNPTLMENFRPVVSLPALSKIFKYGMLDKLQNFLNKNPFSQIINMTLGLTNQL